MRRGNLTFLFLVLLATHAVAEMPATKAAQHLILEAWINGANTNVDVTLVKREGKWWIARSDLKAVGIVVADRSDRSALVPLATLDGISANIDDADQRLIIKARADCLAPQRIDLRPSLASAEPSSTSGLVASYEITGTTGLVGHGTDASGLNAAYGATLFTPQATFTWTGFARALDGAPQFVRLDSTAEWDEPEILRRWLIGDAVSGGLEWSRSVRFGGIQIATDFSLQAGLATFPLPAFFGQTAVPGTVDVFVNSAKVFEGDLSPGPFEIRNLPVVTGNGQATVVVHNILGQETEQTFSFYASDVLLQKDLSSYDIDAGFLRELYGVQNFDYRAPIATATYRYGLSDWFTLETHAETASSMQLVGGGGAVAIGSYGVITADASASDSWLGQGELYSFSFQSQSRPFGLFGSASATAGNYADLASIGGFVPSRLRTQLGADFSFNEDGAVAASWIEDKENDEQASQLVTGSYTLSFQQGWYFSATGLHDCANGGWAGEVGLSIPIGQNLIATASAQSGAGTNGITAGLMRPTNPDGGFGYSVSAIEGDTRSENGDVTWIGSKGSLDGAISSVNGDTAARLTASGALVAMNGSVFATRSPDGPVALVETGNPNIPVYLENREVAVSDSNGEALVPNLSANAANRIGIQPTDYSFNTIVTTTEQTVVPRRQGGVVVDLSPKRGRPALIILQSDDGQLLAAGGEVMLSGDSIPLVVGHDGQVFIPDLEKTVEGTVSYPFDSCHFRVDPPIASGTDTIPRIGPVSCRKEPSDAA